MKRNVRISTLILGFILAGAIWVQAQSVGDIITRMTTNLDLTPPQAEAVRPIIKDYMAKRQEFLQDLQGQAIVDKTAVRATLEQFKKQEVQGLAQILTQDQMKKWAQQQALKARLNHDQGDTTSGYDDEDNVTLSPDGATFHF